LLNLQIQLENWVKRPPRSQDYEKKEIKEYNTSFLSSDILLQIKKSIIKKDDYFDNIIRISPTKKELGANLPYFIPYMKSIIGCKDLPVLNPSLNAFTYYDEQNIERKFSDKPLKVETILTSAYYSILKDYIEPSIIEKKIKRDQLNKIVLTMPNTFTPRHVDYIKYLIKDNFRFLKENYITFVSESDAVACYYFLQKGLLNTQSKRSKTEIKKLDENLEHVLVYDMGAGTVDLTYFRISPKNNKNEQKVEILLKMGSCTAGNYLDYIISKAIFEMFKEKLKITFDNEKGLSRSIDIYGRSTLKNIVIEKIKPKLNKDIDVIIKKDDFKHPVITDNITINTKILREKPSIQEYIKKNTKDFFNAFFHLKSEYNRKKSVPINTVILTGRAVQFESLKKQIKKEIADWSSNSNVHYIDNIEKDTLKSIVVNGALYYAKKFREQHSSKVKFINKNVHARYGFLYDDPVEEWKFEELINPDTDHVPLEIQMKTNEDEYIVKDGIAVYQYDTDKYSAKNRINNSTGNINSIDLSRATSVFFVQSFSNNTAQDMKENRMDYISIMSEFDVEEVCPGNINNDKVPVRVTINKKNEMVVQINQKINAPTDPLQINVKDNKLFKQSMWPYFE